MESAPQPPTTQDVGGVAATLARFDRPRGPGTTLAVLADAHLTSQSRNSAARTPADRGSSASEDGRRRLLEIALEDARRLDVDGVLVAGDLTRSGAGLDHELAATVLEDAPSPVVTVPGDRDVALDGDARYPESWTDATGPQDCPFARCVGGVTVLGVDTATGDGGRPTATHGGAITRAERAWLARTAAAAEDPVLCLSHHPIAPLPAPFDVALDDRRHRVRAPGETADALAAAGIELSIAGHLRWPTATRFRGINAVGAPATAGFPPSYLLIDVEPRGTTVSLVPLTDWEGLEASYRAASARGARGEAVRTAVTEGYFGDLPCVDRQREPAAAVAPTTVPRRP